MTVIKGVFFLALCHQEQDKVLRITNVLNSRKTNNKLKFLPLHVVVLHRHDMSVFIFCPVAFKTVRLPQGGFEHGVSLHQPRPCLGGYI